MHKHKEISSYVLSALSMCDDPLMPATKAAPRRCLAISTYRGKARQDDFEKYLATCEVYAAPQIESVLCPFYPFGQELVSDGRDIVPELPMGSGKNGQRLS